jgi:hypothetical protein
MSARRFIWLESDIEILNEDEVRTAGGPGSGRYPKGSGSAPHLESVGALINKLQEISPAPIIPQSRDQLLHDPDAAIIESQGRLVEASKNNRQGVFGPDGECHWNVADLFREGKIDAIVIGYAKNRSAGWHQHTWGEKDGKIVETTPSNMSSTHYFGVALDKQDSRAFAAWTKANKPGMGKVRRGN